MEHGATAKLSIWRIFVTVNKENTTSCLYSDYNYKNDILHVDKDLEGI